MSSLGGIGFSNTSSATTRKKRSTTLRRPWNERQLQDASSMPSTPIPDNNENKIKEREAVESDEGSSNKTERRAGFDEKTVVNKVKLKIGRSSKTINAISSSDGASELRGTPLDTASRADSCNDTRDGKTSM